MSDDPLEADTECGMKSVCGVSLGCVAFEDGVASRDTVESGGSVASGSGVISDGGGCGLGMVVVGHAGRSPCRGVGKLLALMKTELSGSGPMQK